MVWHVFIIVSVELSRYCLGIIYIIYTLSRISSSLPQLLFLMLFWSHQLAPSALIRFDKFNQWISIKHENKRPTTYKKHYLPFSQFIYDQWNIKTLWIHSRHRDGLNFYFYLCSLFQSCKSIVRTSFRHEYLSRQRGLIFVRWKLTKATVALKIVMKRRDHNILIWLWIDADLRWEIKNVIFLLVWCCPLSAQLRPLMARLYLISCNIDEPEPIVLNVPTKTPKKSWQFIGDFLFWMLLKERINSQIWLEV